MQEGSMKMKIRARACGFGFRFNVTDEDGARAWRRQASKRGGNVNCENFLICVRPDKLDSRIRLGPPLLNRLPPEFGR